jgi:high-affinity iron transporter
MPSLKSGKAVFGENCAQCHGETGKGDGPSRATLNPPRPEPTDFTSPDVMVTLSPFRIFNVASFGVEGTAMPDFSALPETERWQVAFYVGSLRFSANDSRLGKTLVQTKELPNDLKSLATLATVSDEELLGRLKGQFQDGRDAAKALAYLRRGLLEQAGADPLVAARLLLKEAMDLYRDGESEKAYQKAVEAYLDGFELAEPALFSRDASLARELESRLGRFRAAMKSGESPAEVWKLYREIDAGLVRSSELLSSKGNLNVTYVFLNAFAIIVREGLEAALVLAAILTLLRVMGTTGVARYIHLGWILAVLAGCFTWLLAQTTLTLSGTHRESVEGFTTLLAAIVLFYVGYWLHTRAEAKKWQKFLRERIQGALSSGRILALVGVSFFAVYREAFEVVLFYQALWLQDSAGHQSVIAGFLAGVVFLSVVVFLLLRLGLKIPVRYFFGLTGSLLYLLAFVFAGEGIKELQTAGWVGVTPLPFLPEVNLLGIYPTLETLMAQGLMVLALSAALFWVGRQRLADVSVRDRA